MSCTSFPMALTYRMLGGFPGSVTRTHPQWIEPCKADTTGPALAPGMAVKVADAGDCVTVFDGGDNIYGIVVRVYPWQPFVINADGSQTTPVPVVDILREGYCMVKVAGVPAGKDSEAFVATDGNFSAVSGTGPLKNFRFNGPPDANGCAEGIVTIPAGPHDSVA